jgi:hypothetical protein
MRFLLTSYEYPQFMQWLYERHPNLQSDEYERQLACRQATGFLWSDYYSKNLAALGHEAIEVLPDHPYLQLVWAKEHDLRLRFHRWDFSLRRGIVPWLRRVHNSSWMLRVFGEQIRAHRPDVLLIRDIGSTPADFLREMKQHVGLIVGQHASPFDRNMDYGAYDLMLSSLPNYVDYFRSIGIPSELLRLGFEATLLDRLGPREPSIDVSFVGKLSGDHKERARFIDRLCRELTIELWGSSTKGLAPHALRQYRGSAWGADMFAVTRKSKVALNQHEAWAGAHANNLRLYEATGVGTFLLTDWKPDLDRLFIPGVEVVTYQSLEECVEMAQYYLAHDEERETIARAGQARTLKEHTYDKRMIELVDIITKYR